MPIKDLIPSWRKGGPARREEGDPFSLFRREMDSLMENFFRGVEGGAFESRLGVFSPKVDVTEGEKEITVSAELPGMDEKDIELSLTKDSLTIRGEKKQEKEEKTTDYYRTERSYGSFVRAIPLPVEIDEEKVEASFKKGLLTVTLPKTEKAVKETKKIPISSS